MGMVESSNHTRLINLIINLSVKNRQCKPVLYEHNYFLDTIEVEFNKLDGRKISADVLLKNPQLNRLLFLECKDGGLEVDQAQRYNSMSSEDISKARITTSSGKIVHEVAYLGTRKKRDKLIEGIKLNNLEFPVLIESHQNGEHEIKLEHNHFSCDTLEYIFSKSSGVNISRFSLNYYPFGKDDSDAYILSRISPALIHFMVNGDEFDPEDILKMTHNLFNHIDSHSINDLKGRIGKLLKDLSKDKLDGYFDKATEKGFKLKPSKGVIGFKGKLEKVIEELDINVIQKSISDFLQDAPPRADI